MLVPKNLKRNVNNYKPIKRQISELFLFRVKVTIWLHLLIMQRDLLFFVSYYKSKSYYKQKYHI